jgi:flagellar biogenesis protein FliO
MMMSNIEDFDEQEESVLSVDDEEEAKEKEKMTNVKDNEALAQRETRALQLVRALLAIILISSIALASWLVFRFMRRAEQQLFLSQVSLQL